MGKRQRKQEKAANAGSRPRLDDELGAPGPFMVCRECREPLALYSVTSPGGATEKVAYLHSLEYVDSDQIVRAAGPGAGYDHEAVPVEATPLDAKTVCDFCYGPEPRHVFVPRRPVRMDNPLVPGHVLDYSSPWHCCARCLPAVKSKNITRMLNAALYSRYGQAAGLTAGQRAAVRPGLRELYSRYLQSAPAGPYEVRIRPAPRPLGRRGSARGMGNPGLQPGQRGPSPGRR